MDKISLCSAWLVRKWNNKKITNQELDFFFNLFLAGKLDLNFGGEGNNRIFVEST